MTGSPRIDKLDRIADRCASRRDTSSPVWRVEHPEIEGGWSHGDSDAPYVLASITKLYTTALMLQLADAETVDLDAAASDYLPPGTMIGLNRHGGVDHADRITLRHLLSHTSGIPDYFADKAPGGSLMSQVLEADRGWGFDEALDRTRSMNSMFAPDATRAHYSDTNFQLLGAVIERVSGAAWEAAITERIVRPLGLTSTFALSETEQRGDDTAPLLYRSRQVKLPLALASVRAQGGLASTTRESIRFLRAFLGGELFDARHPAHLMSTANRIQSPLRYGTGMMRFALPRYASPFSPVPPLWGHAGSSGSALFAIPERDIYFAGTVNQFATPSLPFRTMAMLALEATR